MIPYGRQDITETDIEAVVDVLRSDYLTQGPAVPKFERAVADYCQVSYGVAVNSATSALHLACRAIGIVEGDRVWTSPITFVASANCALYCGATIDFVDIDSRTGNIDPHALEEKLKVAKIRGELPKAVIPVHLAGQPCEMADLHAIAEQYGFAIIEDASHAIGARYRNEPVGNCRFSDITVFSFHPVKIITTGEGGVAVTNQINLAEKMSLLRSHGVTRDLGKMTHAPDGPWYYQQVDLGYNYRMTDIQAALGLSQLERLDDYVAKRNILAERYNTLLSELPVNNLYQNPDSYSSWHLYVIRLQMDNIAHTHHEVFDSLREQGIGVNLHYIPVHTQPYYKRMGFKSGDFPKAEDYYSRAISLPLYPTMTDAQQSKVIDCLKSILG